MTTIPFILLALLCCVMGCTATEYPKFRCMHDEVMKNSGAMPVPIVEPGPDKSGVQGAAVTASDPAWAPIRFQVFSEDLNSPSRYCTAAGQMRPTFEEPSQTAKCTSVDILTPDKKSQLLNLMIPPALKLHSDRLLVQPLTGNIIARKYTSGFCGSFTIPQAHYTTGVSGADMVLYVASGPTGDASAWAVYCSFADNKRPVTGVINAGPAMIGTKERDMRTVAHEIAHALGFNQNILERQKMVSNVPNIRGQTRLVVTSRVTLSKAKAHYNCNSIAGMELENEGVHVEEAGSHWERRNARDELMALVTDAGRYTAITMAAFEDQGYYRANWGKEETMEWGRNAGCPFLTEKCVNNGKTKYPNMFCTELTSTSVCTHNRKAIGKCKIKKYESPLPVEYRYFSDTKLGGSSRFMDYCPAVAPYEYGGCTDGNPARLPGSRIGPNSMCLKGEGLRLKGSSNAVQDICAEVTCYKNTVAVRYLGDNMLYPCPENTKITPKGAFSGGKIVCPRRADVCGTN